MSTRDQREEFELAARALAELQALHKAFLGHVERHQNKSFNGGSLSVLGDHITATCLGVPLVVTHRPIVRDQRLSALEYEFSTERDDEKLTLWHLYLEPNGQLYTDSNLQNRFCDYHNEYLASRIIGALANALLKSKLFAPNA